MPHPPKLLGYFLTKIIVSTRFYRQEIRDDQACSTGNTYSKINPATLCNCCGYIPVYQAQPESPVSTKLSVTTMR